VTETPRELLDLARDMVERPPVRTHAVWPRAAALLARQALEAHLDRYWHGRGLDMDAVSMRAQLICLPEYAPDAIAGEAAHAWSALSSACHVHAYDLPPTATELEGLCASVERVIDGLGAGTD